ncbi:uncharacterized protein LACBIDRAFT_334346 [Laccaria bicolor S238N-H82]|uniref:Predicted protein n=1 Tax=Laccaria bicolor (strain S238N-H82 / ATCC MYA-4686) TaxID=486041 RepID=B0DYX3_LACBS|nr:uncharacterized protein LACBIDRAFT_334346 [Laccaria bicolor S238N-H82]EDR00241.1 predicted protein [Laccaria bicolor S238N-H82]|eukprot:XP_001889150.1 predicted protein [Laccaria bicolor S238N-H82]
MAVGLITTREAVPDMDVRKDSQSQKSGMARARFRRNSTRGMAIHLFSKSLQQLVAIQAWIVGSESRVSGHSDCEEAVPDMDVRKDSQSQKSGMARARFQRNSTRGMAIFLYKVKVKNKKKRWTM